jgi:predicted enzyme related to lactoylglutathione lyase
MQNRVVWFDIAVSDLQRAKAFYSKVFDIEMIENEMEPNKMAMFPFEPSIASGCLVQGSDYKPSAEGAMVYLNGGDDLSVPLSRVEQAGGTVLLDKMSIGEYGFIAYFLDTEGNKVALRSMS